MRILFLHNNFPAQFGPIGQYLAAQGWEVTYLTQRKGAKAPDMEVMVYRDREQPKAHEGGHPFLSSTGKAVVTGTSALEVALHLRTSRGYVPDLIVAHSGWGPGMYLKDVWPEAKYIGYFEWFYRPEADDITFLDGAPRPAMENARERTRNGPILIDLLGCDLGLVPTAYQAAQFPAEFSAKLRVMHDGIDTATYAPADPGEVALGDRTFRLGDEIVTYVARGMEPYRGFPEFMATLADAQKRRPQLQAIIVGEDRVAYGRQRSDGKTFKTDALETLDLDLDRIIFTGLLPRTAYRDVLRISSVHAYFTVPFVLSWSMMEAMSTGCLILGSDTAPVRELISHGENGLLVNFRDAGARVDALCDALERQAEMGPLRAAARKTITDRYAQRDIFPAKKVLFSSVVG